MNYFPVDLKFSKSLLAENELYDEHSVLGQIEDERGCIYGELNGVSLPFIAELLRRSNAYDALKIGLANAADVLGGSRWNLIAYKAARVILYEVEMGTSYAYKGLGEGESVRERAQWFGCLVEELKQAEAILSGWIYYDAGEKHVLDRAIQRARGLESIRKTLLKVRGL